MKKKVALITGINGQDGSYLAKFLLEKNFKIYGISRRTSNYKFQRLKYLGIFDKIKIIYGDIVEYEYFSKIIKNLKPDYLFNLAAQSFVDYSFDNKFTTYEVNNKAVYNMLETIKNFSVKTKFYQASTSEMYGNSKKKFQNETTEFNPISPYAVSKVSAHDLVRIYRNSFKIFACSGILFNHESPLRGPEFVTKKIISSLVRVKHKNAKPVELGNLYSFRDWGYVEDYVEAIYKIINHSKPDDFVVGTGVSTSILDFFKLACEEIGLNPVFHKKGVKKYCYDKKTKKKIMIVKKQFFRDQELHYLKADIKKIKKTLNWRPKTNLRKLVKKMINYELEKIKNPQEEHFY
tara:strand:+ start:116 stop:1159 length:1044 start_codon:yes stop_codon:yes gene_type:complete